MNSPAPPTEGQILTGPLFDEPMRVETVAEAGPDAWTLGLVGTRSERFRRVSLGAAELAALTVLDSGFRHDGDGALLRLGLQAHALGIAWEFDPYFGLSVSRVDPLPHQLEAVYDHLLKLARAPRPGRRRRGRRADGGRGEARQARRPAAWRGALPQHLPERPGGAGVEEAEPGMPVERRARDRERRVVPETIARFLRDAAPLVSLRLDFVAGLPHRRFRCRASSA